MNTDLMKREQLSALADGELQGEELAQALQFATQDEGQSTWQIYHLVGDVLRAPELARHQPGNQSMVMRLREQLAQEPLYGRLSEAMPEVQQVAMPETAVAANSSVFLWKMAAGFASLAAVAAIAVARPRIAAIAVDRIAEGHGAGDAGIAIAALLDRRLRRSDHDGRPHPGAAVAPHPAV